MAQSSLANSNIALMNSELATSVRKAAASCEEEFEGAGSKAGIEIWRIENFGVKRWPESQNGRFYNGDSYIVLNTYKKEGSDTLHYNVHFWLGQSTSQDEAGTAAYKCVELDTKLDDMPVQYREVSGSESDEFLALFEPIIVMDGGIDSGFNVVKPEEYTPRLLHIKGTRKNIRLAQVPLARASLNDGDVFLLDAGLELFQWNGTSAGVFEKRRANEIVAQLKEERNGKPVSTVLDGQEESEGFWGKLDGGFGDVVSAEAGGADDEVAKPRPKQLWKLSDATGEMVMSKVSEGADVKAEQLDENDVFIVDDSGVALFVWIGKGASADEKGKAFQYANAYIEQEKLPLNIPVSRNVQGNTSSAFEKAISG